MMSPNQTDSQARPSPPSAFAAALRSLLTSIPDVNLEDWAGMLEVTPSAISHWLADRHLPRPAVLRRLLLIVQNDSRVPKPALDHFQAITRQPSTHVSPLGDRMAPTISHYLLEPLVEATLRTLRTLPAETQEELLYELASQCREVRRQPVRPERPASSPSVFPNAYAQYGRNKILEATKSLQISGPFALVAGT